MDEEIAGRLLDVPFDCDIPSSGRIGTYSGIPKWITPTSSMQRKNSAKAAESDFDRKSLRKKLDCVLNATDQIVSLFCLQHENTL